MNKVILIGRLGGDPETKSFKGGNMVMKFSLATSRNWKNKQGEWETDTSWHRCQAWGKLAEIYSPLIKKGDLVVCEGEIKYGQYDKNGVTMYTTDISCHSIRQLSKRENKQSYDQNAGFPDNDSAPAWGG